MHTHERRERARRVEALAERLVRELGPHSPQASLAFAPGTAVPFSYEYRTDRPAAFPSGGAHPRRRHAQVWLAPSREYADEDGDDAEPIVREVTVVASPTDVFRHRLAYPRGILTMCLPTGESFPGGARGPRWSGEDFTGGVMWTLPAEDEDTIARLTHGLVGLVVDYFAAEMALGRIERILAQHLPLAEVRVGPDPALRIEHTLRAEHPPARFAMDVAFLAPHLAPCGRITVDVRCAAASAEVFRGCTRIGGAFHRGFPYADPEGRAAALHSLCAFVTSVARLVAPRQPPPTEPFLRAMSAAASPERRRAAVVDCLAAALASPSSRPSSSPRPTTDELLDTIRAAPRSFPEDLQRICAGFPEDLQRIAQALLDKYTPRR